MSVAMEESAPCMLLASIGFRVQLHKLGEALSAVDETVAACGRPRLRAHAAARRHRRPEHVR